MNGLSHVPERVDVAVIGAGQAGLAAGYHLRKSGLDYVLLDAASEPGGSWPHTWPSLRMFSAAPHSSLPGWPMPHSGTDYPSRDDVVDYLARYERRYQLPIRRSVEVHLVRRDGDALRLESAQGTWRARAVISATGTASRPFTPGLRGRADFAGRQLHSADYRGPEPFAGQRVLVVGGGNSAAQILAEVSTVADTLWATRRPPQIMPDHVDGRVLFNTATAHRRAREAGRQAAGIGGLGDIVAVAPVREARERGVLVRQQMPARLVADGAIWADGHFRRLDAVIWCTGFRPALEHLEPLGVLDTSGRVAVQGTRSLIEPRLWLLGYGSWTGFASATLIGSGRWARQTVDEMRAALEVAVAA
jgi:cation diffusion facilitator CzcD-associated flavoprotein CzcO